MSSDAAQLTSWWESRDDAGVRGRPGRGAAAPAAAAAVGRVAIYRQLIGGRVPS